jgi:RCC1 and BTB domain-containing protein
LIFENSKFLQQHALIDVLSFRCEHFQSMFQEHWEDHDKSTLEISQFSYTVFRAFICYLYTDKVQLMPEDAIGLLELANCYCENKLKRRCEESIMQGITVDNAAMLYATAIQFNAHDLDEFCFKFCLNHMTNVVQTEAFSLLDDQTCKDFIAKAAKNGAFKS